MLALRGTPLPSSKFPSQTPKSQLSPGPEQSSFYCPGYYTPLTFQNSIFMQNLTESEQQALYDSYARLPTPPEGPGEDIGLDFNPHLPPSPLARAVDSAADSEDLSRLPSIPDTPQGISQFEFGNRASFDTSVQDLIQPLPDTPIGGIPAAPMRRSIPLTVNNCDGRPSPSSPHTPRIEIHSPQSSDGTTLKRPTLPRSKFSDPFEATASPKSDRSMPMITAPESPGAKRRRSGSSNGSTTNLKDGKLGYDGSESGACCDPPSLEELCPASEVCPDGILNPSDPIPTAPDIQSLPSPALPTLPMDATGALAAPQTPKARKGSRGRAKIKKGVCKGRCVCLRTPILSLLIGRQLAGPTKQALRSVSKGVPANTDNITRASSLPIPA